MLQSHLSQLDYGLLLTGCKGLTLQSSQHCSLGVPAGAGATLGAVERAGQRSAAEECVPGKALH